MTVAIAADGRTGQLAMGLISLGPTDRVLQFYPTSTYVLCMLPPGTANKLWIFGSLAMSLINVVVGAHITVVFSPHASRAPFFLSFAFLSFSADISAAGGRARPSQFPLGARAQRGREQKGN